MAQINLSVPNCESAGETHGRADTAFSRLIEAHGTLINRVCYMYAGCVEDFEDMRQEVYVNLWRGMGSFRGESGESTWVYRVALNSCVSYSRKNRHQSELTPLSALTDVADSGNDERAAMLSEMHSLINQLDRVEKAMILLWLNENTYDVIAEIMNMPRNTVASRLRRIKEKLVKFSNE